MIYIKNKNFYFCIKLIISLILFINFFSSAEAVTLNKSVYDYGEDILYQEAVGATIVWNLSSDSPTFLGSEHEALFNINEGGAIFDNGYYVIMEHQSGDNDCYWLMQTAEECRNSPEFINEFFFTVNTRIIDGGGGGGGSEEPPLEEGLTPASGAFVYYPPLVNIFSIPKGSFFSDKLTIDYSVTDPNDKGGSLERAVSGLGNKLASISFSDKVLEGLNSFLYSSDRTEIAKDQPLVGKYEWSVKDLIPGTLYRIVVEAIDMTGLLGQGISEFFGVDFTAPVFTVKVNPPAIRNGEVNISVDASEDLGKIPEVKVTQNGGESKLVTMKGDGSHYEGTYKVISGFDGLATIKISGVDIAGNKSEEIVAGGSFSVGINPPPKPNIKGLTDKFTTNEEFIDISGSTRLDTEVILSVNNIEIFRLKPDKDGNFIFNKIQLDKTKNNGLNYISIVAKDPLGTLSEESLLRVKYNIAPTVKILKPIEKEIISNIYNINVEGKDDNNDNIFYTYQVVSLADFKSKIINWVTISEDNPSKGFPWNTAEVADGSYVLQVIANDKEAKTISLPVLVTIKNVLPSFSFEDGRSTTTNKSNIVIKGKVLTSTNVSPRPSILNLAYSMDNGLTWTPVKLTNDGGDYQKKFAVEFKDMKEGTYPILWRTKDSRDFIGKIIHPIIVDKTAPKIPIITFPRIEKNKDLIINNENDENLKKDGIQITLKGRTDAFNNVSLYYNNQTINTKALATGEFIFQDITFNTKGKYTLNISTSDLALNKSEAVSFSIIYNNPPIISFLSPKQFRGLSGNANISWSIKDIDNDNISNIVVSYRNKDKDISWKILVSNANAIDSYNWNTDKLSESNNYELKIEANDTYSMASEILSFSIDRTVPILSSLVFDKNQTDEKSKKTSFICSGEARDNLSGVEFVEYSIENKDGKLSPWYKSLITSGYLKNKVTYQIKHPVMSEDGGYKVLVRAVDSSGNISEQKSLSLFVDKTAPRVGGFFLKKGNVTLNPNEEGSFTIYKNSPFIFNVSLEEDTESASIKIGDRIFELKKDTKLQLWQTDISVNKEELEDLFITAKDTSTNIIIDKKIGSITASSRGQVSEEKGDNQKELIVGAEINVLKLNKDTNQYNDFTILGNNSSKVQTNKSGEYDLVLPEGDYQLVIKGSTIKTFKYKLSVERSSIINLDFKVSEASGLSKFFSKLLDIFR